MLLARCQRFLLIDEFDAVLEGRDEFLLATHHDVVIKHVRLLSHYLNLLDLLSHLRVLSSYKLLFELQAGEFGGAGASLGTVATSTLSLSINIDYLSRLNIHIVVEGLAEAHVVPRLLQLLLL